MGDGKIHIPGRKKKKAEGRQVVKLTEEAYNLLVDIYNESSVSMMQIASTIIIASADRIVYDREDD